MKDIKYCPACKGDLVEVVVWDGVNKSGSGGAILVHDELECESCHRAFMVKVVFDATASQQS